MNITDLHENHDIYDIVNDGGEKILIYIGYYYTEGEEETPGKEDVWRFVDYTGSDMSLSEFLELKNLDNVETIEDLLCEAEIDDQYFDCITEKEAEEEMKREFDGRQELNFANITENTPCGRYYNTDTNIKEINKEKQVKEQEEPYYDL